MSSEVPKRRLPRFSLITLIVAVNVAGVLVWANVAKRDQYRAIEVHGILSPQVPFKVSGFPLIHRERMHVKLLGNKGTRSFASMAFNLLFAIVAICGSALLTELLVRRFRKAKS